MVVSCVTVSCVMSFHVFRHDLCGLTTQFSIAAYPCLLLLLLLRLPPMKRERKKRERKKGGASSSYKYNRKIKQECVHPPPPCPFFFCAAGRRRAALPRSRLETPGPHRRRRLGHRYPPLPVLASFFLTTTTTRRHRHHHVTPSSCCPFWIPQQVALAIKMGKRRKAAVVVPAVAVSWLGGGGLGRCAKMWLAVSCQGTARILSS
jgi:hypothetical protein